MSRNVEHSIFGFEVRELEATGPGASGRYTKLEGRAVPYDTWANVGPYMELFKRGAFAKSISDAKRANRQIPLLLFHGRDDLWPIGAAEQWREAADGLHGEWRLNDSTNAQRAAAMARSGELGFLSIGFQSIRTVPEMVADSDYAPMLGEAHMDRLTQVEARLVETSLVPTPAYADAQVTLVRSYSRPPGPDPHPKLTAYKRIAAELPR